MENTRSIRIVVGLLACTFGALGLATWFAPEHVAQHFHIAAVGTAGVGTLRADLGGLFVGLGVLCGLAAWTGRAPLLVAAALVLAAVAVGRVVAWFAGAPMGTPELLVELGAIATLMFCAHTLHRAHASSTPCAAKAPNPSRRRWVAATAGAAVALALAAMLLSTNVQQAVFDRAAQSYTARVTTEPLAHDALRVAVCGSSAPLPSAARAKACIAVFAGGKFYVVDAGPESTENLVLWKIPLSEIGGVFITHYHSDHIGDLGELHLQTWAGGRREPLRVYGGPGIEQVVEGFNQAYRLDQGYRTEHHGEHVMPSAVWSMTPHRIELVGPPTPEKSRTAVVLEKDGLRVTAIEVNHAPVAPAYAYRFDYKGRSAVITGDLKYHPALAKAAADADILVSEAIATSMTKSLGRAAHSIRRERTAAIMHDIEDYHITPEQASQIANDARVSLLVFYHLLPAPDSFITRRLFAHGVNSVRHGDWTLAEDGSLYTLPIGSRDVRIGAID